MQFLVALLVGASVSTWVYTKLIRSTGGNVKSTLIAAGIVGLGAFLVVFILAKAYLH